MSRPENPTLHVIGDSNAYGSFEIAHGQRHPLHLIWLRRLQASLPQFDLRSYCTGSRQLIGVNYFGVASGVDVAKRIAITATYTESSAAIVALGTNDALFADPAVTSLELYRRTKRGVSAIAKRIGEVMPLQRVLFVSPLDTYPNRDDCVDPKTAMNRILAIRSALEEQTEATGTQYSDTVTFIPPDDSDGIHISAAGHELYFRSLQLDLTMTGIATEQV